MPPDRLRTSDFGLRNPLTWLGRYGGYLLIFVGALTLSSIVPSAAGPPDALGGQRPAAPVVAPRTGGAGGGPLLITSPRREGGTGWWGAQPPKGGGGAPPAGRPAAAPRPAPAPTTTAPARPAEPPAPPPAPAVAEALTPAPTPPPPSTDRIVIARIGVDARVVDVGVLPTGEMETAAFAAGRLAASAQAGEPGNAVIAGHNDTQGQVFRRLPELKPGDEIVLYRGDTVYRYRVDARTIVREEGATPAQRRENAQWMEPTDDATSTLISCYPYRVDTHRVIVRARLVE